MEQPSSSAQDPGPRTLLDKIWADHEIPPRPRASDRSSAPLMFVDLHLIQEVSSPQAFEYLAEHQLPVWSPARTLGTADHSTPTLALELLSDFEAGDSTAAQQLRAFRRNCAQHRIECYPIGHERRGIVHVIGPELGLSQPGMTIVCGDSHTSTHGALGALAFGIGTSEVAQVLATQCLIQDKPRNLRVTLSGSLPSGVYSKDMILALIGKLGLDGATDHVIEYQGSAVAALSIEGRMTLCNMSIEAGARAGMVAPDDTTFEYLAKRPRAPQGAAFEQALAFWRALPSDPGAAFDGSISVDVSQLAPQVTWGTNPAMVMAVDAPIPSPTTAEARQALTYMQLEAGARLLGLPVQVAFIGSCTNGRIEDLRIAARILEGRKVAASVRLLIVPGSQAVKRQAESEGLHEIFLGAGAQWRESGCSMCIGMNGDEVGRGQYAISTSNRNFEGRQGAGARTLLASPATVAASALAGAVADPRRAGVARG